MLVDGRCATGWDGGCGVRIGKKDEGSGLDRTGGEWREGLVCVLSCACYGHGAVGDGVRRGDRRWGGDRDHGAGVGVGDPWGDVDDVDDIEQREVVGRSILDEGASRIVS